MEDKDQALLPESEQPDNTTEVTVPQNQEAESELEPAPDSEFQPAAAPAVEEEPQTAYDSRTVVPQTMTDAAQCAEPQASVDESPEQEPQAVPDVPQAQGAPDAPQNQAEQDTNGLSDTSAPKKRRHIVGKIFAFIGATLGCILLILLGVIWVMEKGPSPTATGIFCRSVRETSAIRWISEIFLSDEELEQIKTVSTETEETDTVNPSLIHVESNEETTDSVELIDISEGNCKGKLIIVHDPKQVILGISGTFKTSPGLQLTEIVSNYNGIAGINAGGFNDEGGRGDGGTPQGMVITQGELIWGSETTTYNVIGLDQDGILQIGTMTGQEAVDSGLYWAVSFTTHDGVASSLIINGEVQDDNLGGGVNPRTAIGQREDGALLLLVLDGRSINTLGATLSDVCNIMLEYGAVNAGNLDGGSSSVMVYDGEIINNCASVTGPRRIPTAFVVLEEEYHE